MGTYTLAVNSPRCTVPFHRAKEKKKINAFPRLALIGTEIVKVLLFWSVCAREERERERQVRTDN